jgi:hypothetical protein
MNTTLRNRNERGGVLKIVLIILGVVLAICLVVGIYVATHWKGWVANAANRAAESILRDSGLPDDQRNSITADIRRLGDDFESGRITTQQLGRITQTIANGPLLPLAGVQAARHKYVEPSDMTEKEKADAILNLQRFARGVTEKKISREEVDDVVKPVSDLMPNGRWKLKDKPSRLEIDQFIENVKAKADAAMIPNEPFDLNIADELKKAIQGA